VRSIASRARFENEPLDLLYRARIHRAFDKAIACYQATGDPRVIEEAIDKVTAVSQRSVEALLRQGEKRKVEGGWELQGRVIDAVAYCVHASADGRRHLQVKLPLEGDAVVGYHLPGQQDRPRLQAEVLESLRYRFTFDGWATWAEAPARVQTDADGRATVVFDIPVLTGQAARVEGLFHVTAGNGFWIKDGASNFRGYSFAVPDAKELEVLTRPA
jgi:hypothetical protein